MKRILSYLLCVVVLFSLPVAFAAEDNAVQLFGYQLTDTSLEAYVYARASGNLTVDNFSLSLGGAELPIGKLSSYSADDLGTSWIVIVEPVTSDTVKNAARSVVQSVASGLRGKDNMAVYNPAGSSYDNGKADFISSSSTVMSLVDAALNSSNKEIKLLDTVATALRTFSSNENLRPHKCLLVVTEGRDASTDATLPKLSEEASAQPVTIYTVSIIRDTDPHAQENFQAISKLAEATEGGLAIALEDISTNTTVKGGNAGAEIVDNEKNCYVLSAPYQGMPEIQPEESKLTVSFQSGTQRNESSVEKVDGATVSARAAEANKQSGTENKGAPQPSPGASASGKQSFLDTFREKWPIHNPVLNILLAVLAVLLIVLLCVLLRKKPKKAEENIPEDVPPEGPGGTQPVRGDVTITMTNVKTGIEFKGEVSKGSPTIKAGLEAPLKLSGDPTISRKHMEFVWQNGCLYVQDTNSLNGTKVNGNEIKNKGAVPLSQSDMIHAGESDFRVNWHSNS